MAEGILYHHSWSEFLHSPVTSPTGEPFCISARALAGVPMAHRGSNVETYGQELRLCQSVEFVFDYSSHLFSLTLLKSREYGRQLRNIKASTTSLEIVRFKKRAGRRVYNR